MRPAQPADPPTELWPEWVALADALPESGRMLVVGPSDCGKSTLVWWLAKQLATRGTRAQGTVYEVAVVDADLGQSRIGPPGCVGWQMLGSDESEYYFVGATTPGHRPASALKATCAAAEGASDAGADWTIVDTTGYLEGQVGVALKQAKIKHLVPVHVVVIGEHPSYEEILKPWGEEVTVHRLPVPADCKEKSSGKRSAWRHKCFADWLSGSELGWIEADEVELINKPAAELFGRSADHAEQLHGLLLGFGDVDGKCIGIGLLQAYDFSKDRFLAYCHEVSRRATSVDFGCVRLERDGSQARRPTPNK